MAGRRGGAIIIGQAAVSAILVATLYLPGEMTEISRMVDALIGGATALAVVALFPEQRPCYWSLYSRRECVKTMNSAKIVEEFGERVWKAGNPTARFPFTAPVTEPCNPPIAFVVQRRKEKIFGSPFALSKGMDAYTSTVRTKGEGNRTWLPIRRQRLLLEERAVLAERQPINWPSLASMSWW